MAQVERAAYHAFLVDVALVPVVLVGERQSVVIVVVPARLGQYVGGVHVFRVGRSARQAGAAVVAIGFGFVAVPAAYMQQAVELVGAACHGGGLEPAAVGRAVTGLQARACLLARFDDVVRVEGEVAHRAADGVAAIQHRGRAAQDFYALDDFRVDVVALGFGERTVEERVGDFNAIDLSQDPVTVDAANVVTADAAAQTAAAHGHARFIAHQFFDGVDVLTVELFTVLHGHGAGHADDVLFLTRGADGHLLQGEGAAAGGTFFEDDVIAAQFAVAQVGADQQAVECLFWRQRPAHTR